jgi:hypothetical protein
MLGRSGSAIRVLLPDNGDVAIMAELARRFGMKPEDVQDKIANVLELLKSLPVSEKSSLEVRLAPSAPLFTTYRFDDSVVLALFHHRQRLDSRIVALKAAAPGELYDYTGEEFEALWDASRAS